MTEQPTDQPKGTATPIPNVEADRFKSIAQTIGPDRTCDVPGAAPDYLECGQPARFAILMLGTDSLDALSLVCADHAATDPAKIEEYYDAGDAFAFIVLPRY